MKNILKWLQVGVLTLLTATAASAQTAVQFAQTTNDGSITAINQSVTIPIGTGRGYGTAVLQVTGTFTGTIQVQCATDTARNYIAILLNQVGTATAASTDVTGTGAYKGDIAGCIAVRARSTSWSSGTAVTTLTGYVSGGGGSAASGAVTVTSGNITCSNCSGTGVSVNEDVASANADPGTPAYSVRNDTATGATNANGDYQPLKSDSNGKLWTTDGTVMDVDDGSIAGSQTTALVLGETYIWNGSTWTQWGGAISNAVLTSTKTPVAPATATATTGFLIGSQYNSTPPTFTNGQQGAIQISSAGRLLADAVIISGTTAVTNAGTFVVQENGAALTALQLIDNLPNTLGSTTSGQSGALALGAVTTASPSYTNAQTNALSLDTAGSLRVAIVSGAGSGGTAMADDAAFTVASTSFTPAGGTYKSTRDAVDDNDGGAFAMNAKRAMYVSPETPNSDSMADDTLDAMKVTNSTASTASSYLTVRVSDGSSFLTNSDLTHDGAYTWTSVSGPAVMFQASSSAPTAVSAAQDASAGWVDLNGRLHITGDASMSKLLVTPDANSAINLAQANGVTVLMNNGAAGTGSLRVTQSNDATSLATFGVGATGSAPPANASYIGGVTSGATAGLLTAIPVCDSSGYLDMTTATTTEIAPLVSSRTIHVCSIIAESNGTTVMTLKRGTGTNCGTGTNSVSPAWDLTAQVGFAAGNGFGEVLGAAGAGTVGGAMTSGNALCVTNSQSVNLHVAIRYAVY